MRLKAKEIAYAGVFGGFAFALRASNLVIPIGGPFVIDLRGIPGAVGAALSGPLGGIIVGLLAGLPAKYPIVDVPAFIVAYFLVGLLAGLIKRNELKFLSALAVLAGYPVAAFIVWAIGLLPSFTIALMLVLPRAAVIIPIQLAILYVIFKRVSPILGRPEG
ncbi:MAG: hypothetical protein ACXQTV_01350 [Candidatus Hecatellaceae archaeon]